MVGALREGIRAWRFPGPSVEGLRSPPGEQPWLGSTVAAKQEESLLEARIALADPSEEGSGSWLMIRDDVVVTTAAIVAFLELCIPGGKDVRWQIGGRSGNLVDQLCFGDAGPLLVWLAPGGMVTAERIDAAEPIVVEPKEHEFPLPLPASEQGGDMLDLPVTDRLVLPTAHWVQLLWANLLGLPFFFFRKFAGRNVVEVFFKIGFAVLRAGSIDPARVLAKLGRKGSRCKIHPSAVVEGCWIGDSVTIGANAVVRGSILSDGVTIEDLALVEFSVLSAGSRVQRQGMLKYSVLSPHAAVAGLVQLGVLARGASVKRGGAMLDMSFRADQGVQALFNGQLNDVPLGLIGCCLGENSVVGIGVFVAPGRAIPPDLRIATDAGVLRKIPADAAGTMIVRDGGLAIP